MLTELLANFSLTFTFSPRVGIEVAQTHPGIARPWKNQRAWRVNRTLASPSVREANTYE